MLKAGLKLGNTWEWTYETETNIKAGQTEEAEAKLGSSTVGYNEVIDAYEDTMFKVFAFVSKFGPVSKETAVIFGTVTDEADAPVPNQRVDVITEDGVVQSTITNAQGTYRIFGIPSGVYRVQAEGVTKEVTLVSEQPIELSFSLASSSGSL